MIAADATLAGHERQWDARANNEHARRICPLKNCHARQTKAFSVLCIGMRVSVLSERGDKVDFLISTSFTGMFRVNGMEKLSRTSVLGFLLLSCAFSSTSQEPQALPSADERYKVDILLIVAHADDEGAATPYLAKALDEHKRVGVVFGTRGSSGANEAGAEQAAALGAIREIEARNALTTLGITNVWFLGGKDTASQNVLLSLANWDHGESLEQLVRLPRLPRPESILSLLSRTFIGANHPGHQTTSGLGCEAVQLSVQH